MPATAEWLWGPSIANSIKKDPWWNWILKAKPLAIGEKSIEENPYNYASDKFSQVQKQSKDMDILWWHSDIDKMHNLICSVVSTPWKHRRRQTTTMALQQPWCEWFSLSADVSETTMNLSTFKSPNGSSKVDLLSSNIENNKCNV